MKKLILVALLLSTVIFPVFAEEEHGKCTADAQSCLNWFATNYEGRGWAGVSLDGTDGGLRVSLVHPGTPADSAGVKVGDYLVAINGIEYIPENREKMAKFETMMTPGQEFTYTIARNGKNKDVKFALAEMPMDVVASMVGAHMLNDHAAVEIASADD